MNIVNRYILKNLLVNLGLSLGILIFVMLSAHIFRVLDLIAQGMPPALLGRLLLYLMPNILRYVLPLSILISVVLLFSRMSADSEITALKSGGISLWQLMVPGLFLSLAFSLIGVWLALWICPDSNYRAEQLKWNVITSGPLSILESGRAVAISKTTNVRVGRINGPLLEDIHVYEQANGRLRDITAAYGSILQDVRQGKFGLILQDFTISEQSLDTSDTPPPKDDRTTGNATLLDDAFFLAGRTLTIPLPHENLQDKKPLRRKLKMLNAKELFAEMVIAESEGRSISEHLVHFHSRLVLAFAPLSFFLLGLPFGIRNRRSETSVGLLICVILALVFYAFLLLGESLKDHPAIQPQFILWVPTILYQLGGVAAIARLSRH